MKKTLKDFNFKGKKTLVRVDFNVPLEEGKITDDTRIRAALPTIEYLTRQGARVILMSHLGRPKGQVVDSLRLDPVAERLANLLNQEVSKVDKCVGKGVKETVAKLRDGEVLVLENTRFYPEEKANDPEFSKRLAELADVFVSDAFGAAHRAHASTVGVTAYLPSVAGFLMQRELDALGQVMENPEKPFVAILGGAKVSDKIGVIRNLLNKVDYLLVGGGIANTLLAASGYEMGESLVEEDKLELAKELIQEAQESGTELVLPTDLVIADQFSNQANYRVVPVDQVPEDWQSLDSGGPETLQRYTGIIKQAKTVIWNGPIGVFEMDIFAKGTNTIAAVLAESNATTIIGGGDSAAAVKKAGLAGKMTHISTGGGASLMFMEGKPLPGVIALDDLA
ncbi:MAG: phosphoglycerate kinase [Halanaerobiales bacterium]|nr:phosphoglycerate kinase [Halanaerobiales bacterium]